MKRQSLDPLNYKPHPSIRLLLILLIIFYCFMTIPLFPNRYIFEKMVGINVLLSSGEWWRLITPAFVHISFHHLLFNLFSLYLFGSLLGEWVKDWLIMVLFFSSAVFGNWFTYMFAPPAFVHLGASGGVFGFLGFFASLIVTQRLSGKQAKTIGMMILFAIFFSFFQTDVNMYAHIGGFLWGIIFGYFLNRKRNS